MTETLPTYIPAVFALTTFATLLLFYFTIKSSPIPRFKSKATGIAFGLTIWLIVQALVTFYNFYTTDTTSFPPRFLLLVVPPVLTIAVLFISKNGRHFMDSLPLIHLTYLNVVRLPVELVLYWLFLYKAVPELMTFTGRNFDILAGITAPILAYFGLRQKMLGRRTILIWNFIALGLLMNIVIHAVLSAPFSFQQFAFDQPNIAVLHFPFSWLPEFIVPIVLFGHLVSIRQLLRINQNREAV